MPRKPTHQTPLSSQEDLVPNPEPVGEVNPVVQTKYQSFIGSLMYLMLGTRPDIAYAVGKLVRFSANPSQAHFDATEHVLSYLNATKELYLKFYPDGDEIHVDAYTDADYAQSKPDRKSTSGHYFYINGTDFSWSSKKQLTVATSTVGIRSLIPHFTTGCLGAAIPKTDRTNRWIIPSTSTAIQRLLSQPPLERTPINSRSIWTWNSTSFASGLNRRSPSCGGFPPT